MSGVSDWGGKTVVESADKIEALPHQSGIKMLLLAPTLPLP